VAQGHEPVKIEKIFGSYCFIEGWAHYCEQMMLDQGFGRPTTAEPTPAETIRAAKYRLAQSSAALLRICRLCVAVKMHCDGMSLEDATRFFQDNCHEEHQPAYEEARRRTFDPLYLLYTVGKLQILKLRSDLQKQEGEHFSLEQFHDEMSAPTAVLETKNRRPDLRDRRGICFRPVHSLPEILLTQPRDLLGHSSIIAY